MPDANNFWDLMETLIMLRLIALIAIILLVGIWFFWSRRKYKFENTKWVFKNQSESYNKLQKACLVWVKNELAFLQSWILTNNLINSNLELPNWFLRRVENINAELEKNNLNPALKEKIKVEIYNCLLAQGCGKAAMQLSEKFKISI